MVCDTNRRNRKSSSHHAPHFNDSVPDDDQLSSLTNEITVCLRHISHKTKISWAIWVKTTLKRQSLLSDLRRPPIVVAYGRFEEKQSKHSFMNKLLVVPAFRSKWFSSYQIRGQQFSRVLIGALKSSLAIRIHCFRDVSRQLRKATFYCVSWWVENYSPTKFATKSTKCARQIPKHCKFKSSSLVMPLNYKNKVFFFIQMIW